MGQISISMASKTPINLLVFNPAQFAFYLSRELAVVRQARTLYRHFDRRRRSEAHHLADDVARFKGRVHAGQFLGKRRRNLSWRSAPRIFAVGFNATSITASCGPLVKR